MFGQLRTLTDVLLVLTLKVAASAPMEPDVEATECIGF